MPGKPVLIIGEVYDPTLSIGGGPVIPPPLQPNPPGIWGGPGSLPPWVMPPIYYPPVVPNPPGIWGGPGSLPPWVMPPIYYPPAGGGSPPGIWGGGNVPMPTPPIANVPGLPPTANPPGWGLRPEHPIVLPPPPTDPPSQVPPGSNWTWAWTPSQGWHPAYVPEGGKPQPPPVTQPPTDPNAPVVNPLPT